MPSDKSHTQKLFKNDFFKKMKLSAYKYYTSDDWKNFPEEMWVLYTPSFGSPP